jgi:phosphinothricin acetyltransferase
MNDVAVVPFTRDHWPAVHRIYAEGIASGHATFTDEPPSWDEFDATRLRGHRLLAVDASGAALGWVAVTYVSGRAVYRGVVEHSIYVAGDARGRGVGRHLLQALIDDTERAGIWTIQTGIFPENTASLALHHALGFRTVGTRERVGLMTYGPMAGTWRDVIAIERRSATVGT